MRFSPNTLYHIYNRGNNRQIIFPTGKNYDFFFKKVDLELKGLCDLLAYCLMPNHFHLLIYISEKSPGLNLLSNQNQQKLARKIGTILSSFSQAINKQEGSVGSLFQQKTKAKILDSNSYSLACFNYIHQNPIKAGLVRRIEDWRYSSFNDYLEEKSTLCNLKLARELIQIQTESNLFYEESYLAIDEGYATKIF